MPTRRATSGPPSRRAGYADTERLVSFVKRAKRLRQLHSWLVREVEAWLPTLHHELREREPLATSALPGLGEQLLHQSETFDPIGRPVLRPTPVDESFDGHSSVATDLLRIEVLFESLISDTRTLPEWRRLQPIAPPLPAEGEQPPPAAALTEPQEQLSWIAIELVDEKDQPVPGEKYRVESSDGRTVAEGTLDANGQARVERIKPGTCQILFPNLDAPAWERI